MREFLLACGLLLGAFGVGAGAHFVQPSALLDRGSEKACVIKGNINSRGEYIYHMPGDEYYTRTKINTWFGERWFCSAAEAEAAGWRHSKV